MILEALLANSDDRSSDLEIITSVFSIAEVAFTEAEKAILKESSQAKLAIERYWASQAVRLVEFHEMIASEARDLVRQSMLEQWSIKPNDAVHIATAKYLGVQAFHTTDRRLLSCNGRFDFAITEPDLLLATTVARPAVGQLPLSPPAEQTLPSTHGVHDD